VSFNVTADAYTRFMGQYSEPLAAEFVAMLDVQAGDRALDVGCGPGALTQQLVRRLGSAYVCAVDPSESFVRALHSRIPEVNVRSAAAEDLPFADDQFDCAVAQLVVHFMTDPVAGLTEMARVTRPGGTVAACVWDHSGGAGPLSDFWRAVNSLDPGAIDESGLAGAREGHLAELFGLAGLAAVESSVLTVRVSFTSFDQWWEPFTLGVGPAGNYVARLDTRRRSELAERCAQLLPQPPFQITASAWTALGHA
jgi:SAM-dependent methyltransferase